MKEILLQQTKVNRIANKLFNLVKVKLNFFMSTTTSDYIFISR